MKALLIVFVVATGILNTIQSGSNATLNKTLDRPLWSIVIIFSVALTTSLVMALVTGQRLPSADDVALVPWWAWVGGVMGATYILSMVLAADQLVVATGILNTIQSGSNATLNKTLDRPLWSIVIIFSVALTTSLVMALVTGQRLPSADDVALVPWWAWVGGVMGATYILSMVLAADQLGAAVFMGVTVTLAVITSLVMDHFGLMGFEQHQAGVGRIVGGLLMVVGLALIGAAVFMGVTVTLAVITSLVMDHFGLMGFEQHQAGVGRIVGGLLMVVGLALIAKF